MTRRYFAFYWTLPVPWAGFTCLPPDADAAASVSRTIRYQRDKVRHHVAGVGGTLRPQDEVVRLELRPDRGSPEIAAEFAALLRRAERADAMVAIVDFAGHEGWRRHGALVGHYDHPRCDRIQIGQDDVHVGGINPFRHFQDWRDRTEANIADKPGHRSRILAVLEGMEDRPFATKAQALNALDMRTHGGKAWTAENLRKFLKTE